MATFRFRMAAQLVGRRIVWVSMLLHQAPIMIALSNRPRSTDIALAVAAVQYLKPEERWCAIRLTMVEWPERGSLGVSIPNGTPGGRGRRRCDRTFGRRRRCGDPRHPPTPLGPITGMGNGSLHE